MRWQANDEPRHERNGFLAWMNLKTLNLWEIEYRAQLEDEYDINRRADLFDALKAIDDLKESLLAISVKDSLKVLKGL